MCVTIMHLEKIIWKFIYLLLKYSHSLYLYLYAILKQINNLIFPIYKEQQLKKSIQELLRLDCQKTIPENLVIIFGPEKPLLTTILSTILWSIEIGIQQISFYDYKNKLIHTIPEICDQLINQTKDYGDVRVIRRGKVKISTLTNGGCYPTINGFQFYHKQLDKEIIVYILGSDDCKPKIADICKEISLNGAVTSPAATTTDDITVINDDKITDLITKKLSESFDEIKLALYFGNLCCTYGCLPWHTRYTEFICVDSQNNYDKNTFLRSIRQYLRCEKRYGK